MKNIWVMLEGRGKKTPQAAFTLIELLVVIAIIGLLASVVLLALNSARGKARDAKRLSDVRQMQSALELYLNDCSAYPPQPASTTLGAGTNLVLAAVLPTSGTTCTNAGWQASVPAGGTTYIAKVPAAPTPVDGVCTAAQNNYVYTTVSGATYNIAFCLGAPAGSIASGPRNATPGSIK